MLTKKDYNELVRIIKDTTLRNRFAGITMQSLIAIHGFNQENLIDKRALITKICDWLYEDNPNFDGRWFRAALGIEINSEKPQMTKRR